MKKSFLQLFRRDKIYVISTVIVLISLVLVLRFATDIVTTVYTTPVKQSLTQKVQETFEAEQRRLLEQAIQIGDLESLQKNIRERDIPNLLSFIQEEIQKRDIGAILITDQNGVTLTRTQAASKRGDFVFQLSSWGRAVARGEDVAVIVRGIAHPLEMGAGHLIQENGETIGAVFPAHIFDKEYAEMFSREHLMEGVQLAFYTLQEGIIADSFQEEKTSDLLSSYFNKAELTSTEFLSGVKINGRYFAVEHIIFPGLEKSPGGVLLFLPQNLFLQSALFAIGFVLFFLFLTFVFHQFDRQRYLAPRHFFVIVLSAVILFLLVSVTTQYQLNKKFVSLQKSPYIIYNSTFHLKPSFDVVDRSFEQIIAIEVKTGGESINAILAVIEYDPEKVVVEEIVTDNSFCDQEFFLEKSILPEKGEVRVACIVPAIGFHEQKGTLAELRLQPLSLEGFTLRFGKESQILAHDGLGTNVLRFVENGSYQVLDFSDRPFPLFSYTHPNSERWYQSKEVGFSWPQVPGSIYRYALNREANYVLTQNDQMTSDNEVTLKAKGEGVSYFHLVRENGDSEPQVARFKVKIDSTPPTIPTIKASTTSVIRGEVVRFEFSGSDEQSGLQPTFYIKINDSIFLPVGSQFYTAFLEKGEHTLVLRTFDNADNFSDAVLLLQVR